VKVSLDIQALDGFDQRVSIEQALEHTALSQCPGQSLYAFITGTIAVAVPSPALEALQELVRAREAAKTDQCKARRRLVASVDRSFHIRNRPHVNLES
jgi:hypothetical protein